MGMVRLANFDEGNLSCYCVDTMFSKTDAVPQSKGPVPEVVHVLVDSEEDFRAYKNDLAEKHPETLMSFIHHGCPGCDNVEIPVENMLD